MNRPKVSIVIPIYNVEKYLKVCLDSLISQTLSDIEIIAVNDGSTDNSINILNDYSSIDNRIKIFNKENGGLGDARNYGIKYITGKYVMFVDSDDWLDTETLYEMFTLAEQYKLDILITQVIFEYLNGSHVREINVEKNKIYEKKDIKAKLIRKLIGPNPDERNQMDQLNSASNKLYRTEIIRRNNLGFVSERSYYGEDLVFNLIFFQLSNRIMILDRAFYHYRKDVSTSLTTQYRKNLFEMRLNLYKFINEYIQKVDIEFRDIYRNALYGRIYHETPATILNECSYSNLSSKIDVRKKIREILSNSYAKLALQKYRPVYKLPRYKKWQYRWLKQNNVYPIYLYYKLKFLLGRLIKK